MQLPAEHSSGRLGRRSWGRDVWNHACAKKDRRMRCRDFFSGNQLLCNGDVSVLLAEFTRIVYPNTNYDFLGTKNQLILFFQVLGR